MKIDILSVLKKDKDAPFQLGMTLSRFAMHCHPPEAWTFPWTHPFGGSIEYGDLSFHLKMHKGDLILNNLSIKMYDVELDDAGGTQYVPKPRLKFWRGCSVRMKEFIPGMTVASVEAILREYGLRFRRFGDVRATEIGGHIVVEDFAIFCFYRRTDDPWLMSISFYHRSHYHWPVRNGWK